MKRTHTSLADGRLHTPQMQHVTCYTLAMTTLSFDQLDYRQDLDDRVCCNGCPNRIQKTEKQSVPASFADKRIAFESDRVQRVGDWITVSWSEWACKAGLALTPPIYPLPDGVMHRCGLIKPPHYQDTTTPEKAPTAPIKAAVAKAKAAPAPAGNWWD